MTRSAKLSVLSCRGNLAEHVLIKIALCIPILHRDLVDHVHDFRQQSRIRNREPRIFHVMLIGRIFTSTLQFLNEWKHLLRNNLIHLSRWIVLKPRPAQLLLLRVEDRILNRFLQTIRLRLLCCVKVIQPLDKKQVSDLLNYFERITYAA